VRVQGGPVAGQVEGRRPGERGLRLQHVLRDVDQDRAGPAGGSQVERLGEDPRQLLGVLHQEVVLGDRQRDALDVRLLEGVRADRGPRHLAGDRDDRHRVHVRVGDRGDQVGRARTGGRHADADLAGHHRVPLGRVPRALLVADEDVAYVLGVVERVVGGEDRSTRDTEDGLRTHLLEGLHQGLCAGEVGERDQVVDPEEEHPRQGD